ncbi:MAG: spore maturation protein [Clostridia bacterium]|nr:spore maturation protein [Clostridia bacterium]
MFDAVIPMLLLLSGIAALIRGRDSFASLARGAGEGMRTVAKLFPILCALLCAVSMLRASGLLDSLASAVSPILKRIGVPPELTPIILLRPFSGSGALAAGSDLMLTYGPDSDIGRIVAIMLGSSETTLYTAAIYMGAAGVNRSRYALVAAFAAELTAFAMAVVSVKVLGL